MLKMISLSFRTSVDVAVGEEYLDVCWCIRYLIDGGDDYLLPNV